MIVLKPVQKDCIDAILRDLKAGLDDIMVQLPTGTGKTIIFVKLLEILLESYPELKANVLVNKIKLVEQTREKLLYLIDEEKIGMFCGSLGEYNGSSAITVGSIQSISNTTEFYNLLIIDECHNAFEVATYETYIARLKKANPKLKIVRFTATPYTKNGYIYGDDLPIKKLTFKRTLIQMINDGNLVPPVFKRCKEAFDTAQLRTKRGEYIAKDVEKMSKDDKKVRLQVEDALPRLKGRKKIVWAATCIEHALIIKREIEYFEKCSIVHSKLTDKERGHNLLEFEEGETRHLVSIQIVTEGYDYPPVDAIVIMVPTRSPVKYVQLIGRGLRVIYALGIELETSEGRLAAIAAGPKQDCLVLDYGEVVEWFGHPSDPYVPGTNKKSGKAEKKCVFCPACETINFLPRATCTSCGYEFLKADKKSDIQRTKALTAEAADVEFNENGRQELELKVLHCIMNDKYNSAKGKECVHLKYTTMAATINEYLPKGTSWHRSFQAETLQHKKLPTKLIVEKRGKYYEVKKRIYE